VPGSGGVAHRTPVDLPTADGRRAQVLAGALTVCLIAVWAIAYPKTPDLAAAVYRVELFRQIGMAVWDEHWYAGHHLPGYSLLLGPLGTLVGLRALGMIAVAASTILFERLARSFYGAPAGWGAAFFAVAAVGDVWAGRMAFALGVPFALAAALALRRGHPLASALLAGLCAAASPVAGALLGLAGLTAALASGTRRPLLVLAVPAAVIVLALAALFPEGGREPYPILSFAATALVTLAFLAALPRSERGLRIGAVLYLLVCVGCLLIDSPFGSNIERYGVLLAGPLLLSSVLADRAAGASTGARRSSPRAALALALGAAVVWVLWGPVRETVAVAGSPATSAAYYAPVERFVATAPGGPLRIEVPLTRTHWEAALLAPSVSLARGWEKQMDTRYDSVLLRPGLTGAAYARWLREQAVSYVALPDVALDPSSAQEGRLIRSGPAFLREVSRSEHWRIFEVLGATPLVSGAARLQSLGHDSFSLRAAAPGTDLVRVRYTRYWALIAGHGCVSRAPGGWTSVRVSAPGTVVVEARFSLGRAIGSGARTCA
jgi:hypothetical protein